MPELARFYGIVIRMYYDDHPPPHFHIEYGDYQAKMDIERLALIQGQLSVAVVVELATHFQLFRRHPRVARCGAIPPCKSFALNIARVLNPLATFSLDSPVASPAISLHFTAGTSRWISMRSSNGPLILLRFNRAEARPL